MVWPQQVPILSESRKLESLSDSERNALLLKLVQRYRLDQQGFERVADVTPDEARTSMILAEIHATRSEVGTVNKSVTDLRKEMSDGQKFLDEKLVKCNAVHEKRMDTIEITVNQNRSDIGWCKKIGATGWTVLLGLIGWMRK